MPRFSCTSILKVLFLWSATSAQVLSQDSRDLNYNHAYGTENEFEFTKRIVVKPQTKKRTGPRLIVGDFKLDVQQGFALSACDLIESQFRLPMTCTCGLSMIHSSAVNYGCELQKQSCSKWQVCARSAYTGTVSLGSPVLTSDFCLKDLHFLGVDLSYGDLCVSVDHGRGEPGVKKCSAQIGGKTCSCRSCNGGSGIRLDCSGVYEGLVSTGCDDISLVRAIQGESASVGVFLPTFLQS